VGVREVTRLDRELEETLGARPRDPAACADVLARAAFACRTDPAAAKRWVEAELLDDVDLSWEHARRNIVTRGIALNGLVGRRFTVGSVECVGRRLAEPCSHLESLARPGLIRPLVHRAGLRADILGDGVIKLGDSVAPR